MNGVTKSIDAALVKIDGALSNGRLRPSTRSEFRSIRRDLIDARNQADRDNKTFVALNWSIQIASIIARLAELLVNYH